MLLKVRKVKADLTCLADDIKQVRAKRESIPVPGLPPSSTTVAAPNGTTQAAASAALGSAGVASMPLSAASQQQKRAGSAGGPVSLGKRPREEGAFVCHSRLFLPEPLVWVRTCVLARVSALSASSWIISIAIPA
jgi:hypothetical protein